MNNPNLILIIDDDLDFANFIYDVALSLHLNCKVTNQSQDFMNAYNASVTLIFLDLNIPDHDGIELLRFIESKKWATDIILMSGVDKHILDSAKEFALSKGLSVVGSFQKPIRLADLETLLKKCISAKLPLDKKSTTPHFELNLTKEELLQAIQEANFVIYYQPKVAISTNRIVGVEALIRWNHPLHGLIGPDHFIPLAESVGLIEQLTWLNIQKAIQEIAVLKEKTGFSGTLSLNLSPYSLHDVDFPDKFLSFIEPFGIKPESIIFEITETGLFKELSNCLDIFTRLRLKKMHLSIDDFGTGYAMMQQLQIIPATEIKMDKSFIQNMFESDSACVAVKKIIEMGHDLGMKVVAEGVETRAQLDYLKTLHCDVAQGYYYSKPIPISELAEWLFINSSKEELT